MRDAITLTGGIVDQGNFDTYERLCHAEVILPSLRRLGSFIDDRNQLRWVPFPARDHSPIDLALSPVHSEFPRRRRFVSGTRDCGLVRDGSTLGHSFRG